ncbi:hypothetical protein PENSTE_c031G09874 [Penicillium steckii]|uniref:Uncharacterized protein n=1 Tax=Penicillium steckii TaxID=303698 RepID=A0A1V6SLJ1_9EURO|nr:hypothetical protein PENSTE_c031G09874 [Penicillium steckii]
MNIISVIWHLYFNFI